MACVFYLDATRFTIPNWLNLLVVALYPCMLLITPHEVDVLSGLYCFGVMFAIGFVLFALKVMGGGDVKLLTALGLWVGLSEAAISLVIYTALLGGLLAVFLLVARYIAPWLLRNKPDATIWPLFTFGKPAPYGLAIAAAFLLLLWNNQIPGVSGL